MNQLISDPRHLRYLLDTNMVSDLVRNPQGEVAQHIVEVGEQFVSTSIIVACELRYDAEKKRSQKLSAQLEAVLAPLCILPLAVGVDKKYGLIRAQLEAQGNMIGPNDLLIAAHALSHGLVLVTDNVCEFMRIDGLKVENWRSR